MISRRKSDMGAESEMAKFMDKYFYAPLLAEGAFSSIQRITNPDMQKSGIDVIATYKGKEFFLDEKAQLYYINKDLPTFAFELEYLMDGKPRTGWLLNEQLRTTHYLLLWPFATVEKAQQLTADRITEVSGLLITKKKLLQYLDSHGLNQLALRKMVVDVRKSRQYGKIDIHKSGVYLFASDPKDYSEAPINIVVRREELNKIAEARYLISPEGFVRMKTR